MYVYFFEVNTVYYYLFLQHMVQNINQWLVVNTIFFVFFILFVGFSSLKYGPSEIVTFGVPFGSMY